MSSSDSSDSNSVVFGVRLPQPVACVLFGVVTLGVMSCCGCISVNVTVPMLLRYESATATVLFDNTSQMDHAYLDAHVHRFPVTFLLERDGEQFRGEITVTKGDHDERKQLIDRIRTRGTVVINHMPWDPTNAMLSRDRNVPGAAALTLVSVGVMFMFAIGWWRMFSPINMLRRAAGRMRDL